MAKEFLRTKLGVLYKGDAWEVLKELPRKSFDLIILDPPYVEYRDERTKNEHWRLERNWRLLFRQVERVMKDDGCAFLFGVPSYYLIVADAIQRFFRVWFDIIWVKPSVTTFYNARIKPLIKHEQILCLVKKDAKVSNITYNYTEIGWKGKPYKAKRSGFSKYAGIVRKPGEYSEFRYPTTVVEFPNKPTMDPEERTPHPTQKPLALIEWLIKGWTNEGEAVLDPFMGSGTTAVACERLGRRWVGVEISEEYCNLTRERVLKVVGGGALDVAPR